MAWFVCLEQLPARPLIDFFIRFRSDVWPFPDLKGVLWLGFCAWNSGSAGQILDFFIRFRSDVWPGHRGGRRLFRHAVPGCFPDLKGVLWLGFCAWNSGSAGQTLEFSFGSGVTFGPGRGTAGGCFVTPCQGVFLI